MHFHRVFIWKALALLSLLVLLDGAVSQEILPRNGSVGGSLIGQACTTSTDCPENAGCRNARYCTCSAGYIHSASLDKCLAFEVALGDECEEYQQCQQGTKMDPYKTCNEEGRCDCTPDAIAAQVNGTIKCLKVAGYGETCLVHEQCVIKLGPSVCDGANCYCFRGYERSGNPSTCVLKVDP